MKYTFLKDYLSFFEKHHAIEFENVIPEKTLSSARHELETVKRQPLQQNVWRNSEAFEKIVKNKNISELASFLLDQKVLRLGYDQIICDPFHLKEFKTLDCFSSINRMVGGWIICIKGDAPDENRTNQQLITFPTIQGNGVLLKANTPIDFSILDERKDHCYLLIAYSSQRATYQPNPKDPFPNYLKELGYRQGEHLNDKMNPILFRQV